MQLLTLMLNSSWEANHICDNDDTVNDCCACEVAATWHQLAAQVMEFIAPKEELKIPDKDLPRVEELQYRMLSGEHRSKGEKRGGNRWFSARLL